MFLAAKAAISPASASGLAANSASSPSLMGEFAEGFPESFRALLVTPVTKVSLGALDGSAAVLISGSIPLFSGDVSLRLFLEEFRGEVHFGGLSQSVFFDFFDPGSLTRMRSPFLPRIVYMEAVSESLDVDTGRVLLVDVEQRAEVRVPKIRGEDGGAGKNQDTVSVATGGVVGGLMMI